MQNRTSLFEISEDVVLESLKKACPIWRLVSPRGHNNSVSNHICLAAYGKQGIRWGIRPRPYDACLGVRFLPFVSRLRVLLLLSFSLYLSVFLSSMLYIIQLASFDLARCLGLTAAALL